MKKENAFLFLDTIARGEEIADLELAGDEAPTGAGVSPKNGALTETCICKGLSTQETLAIISNPINGLRLSPRGEVDCDKEMFHNACPVLNQMLALSLVDAFKARYPKTGTIEGVNQQPPNFKVPAFVEGFDDGGHFATPRRVPREWAESLLTCVPVGYNNGEIIR